MFLSIVSIEIKKKYKIPVFITLIVLGAITRAISVVSYQLESTVEIVDGTIAPVIQLTVVPCIIFEAAFTTDWYTFKKELGQIVPLATSVVVLSSVFTSLVFYYIFNYEFSWEECLVIGIILSATDHVALMSALKEIHISDHLESILAGETLLNETTVLVIYKVLRQSIVNQTESPELFAYFLRLCIGGLAVGAFFAAGMGFVLKRMVNDFYQETNLTIVTTYLTFWICDYSKIEFSGASSVMVLGLFMSAYGKILISPSVEKQLHGIWKILSNNIQMLVFIMAGMLLGKNIGASGIFGVLDFGLVIALFIIIHFIRGLVIILHYPVLKYFGYGINKTDVVILTISGFKGVISSALSLIVFNDTDQDERFRKTVLFFTINIVFLSICLDTLLLKLASHKFKMNRLTAAQESILLGVTTNIIQHINEKIEKLSRKHDLRLVKWDDVLSITGPKVILHEFMSKTKIGKEVLNQNINESVEHLTSLYGCRVSLPYDAMVDEIKRRYYSILKRVYWNSFVSGQCQGTTALTLINSCNKALDTKQDTMNDWLLLEKKVFSHKWMEYYGRYSETPILGSLVRKLIYSNIVKAFDVAHMFVRGSYTAEKIVNHMEINTDAEISSNILEEAHYQIYQCEEFIKKFITDSYPEVIADVQSKMSSFLLLNSQIKMVKRIYEQGVIKELEHRNLYSAIHGNFKMLTFMNNPSIPTLEEMLKKRFKKSNKADIQRILPDVVEKHYQPGTCLFKEGEDVCGAYLIFSGKVEECGFMITNDLSIDNIVGAYSLIPIFGDQYFTTAITKTVLIACFIPLNILLQECFLEEVYRESALHLLVQFRHKFNISNSPEQHIQRIIENSKVWFIQSGSPINLRRGALILMGRLRKDKGVFDLIRPCKKIIVSLEDAIVLIFPPHFGGILRQNRMLADAFVSYFIKFSSRKNKDHVEGQLVMSSFKFESFSSGSDLSD